MVNGLSCLTLADTTKDDKEANESPFSHPVYHQLALINGRINKMTTDELRDELTKADLSNRGDKEVLKKRLKNYHKTSNLSALNLDIEADKNKKRYDYFCIIDFEATCDNPPPANFVPEIIEFPAVLIDVGEKKIVNEFHRYCRPVLNPTLTPFCTGLTNITQDEVDNASTFPEVMKEFEEWLSKYKLGTEYSFVIVTDGPWDLGRFLYHQTLLSDVTFPSFAKAWINLRKTFANFYQRKRCGIKEMLEFIGLKFEGTLHSGIDDSRNIARIAIHLLRDEAPFRPNEKLDETCSKNVMMAVLPINRDEYVKRLQRKKCS